MVNIYLAGQNNFGNRGCEALVRSVSSLIGTALPAATIYCPTYAQELDAAMWPSHSESGINFVPAPPFPSKLKWWSRGCRLLPFVEKMGRPDFNLDPISSSLMDKTDVLIMTGGDVISLDYGVPSLYEWAGFVEQAKRRGKKTMFWGGSIGPFHKKPHVEREMVNHLRGYDAITVRESETAAYLNKIGVNNFIQVTDPAFVLKPEAVNLDEFLPEAVNGVIGINVSPLIRGFRDSEASQTALDNDVAVFAKELVEKHGYGVILLPHVGPLDGGAKNSDYHYMKGLMDRYGLNDPRIRILPPNFNAAQLKYVISKLRFLIAARTHATIGAFSTLVPTISIAYSVKAKGINKDLFGDTRLVLDTPKVSLQTLRDSLALLEREEDDIRRHLESVMPEWKRRAALSAQVLADMLQG